MVPIGSATADETLVALVAGGDERAFEEIDRRYRSLLIARAAPIVGSHEAEDVAQDALVKAQREIVRGARPAALGLWLLTVARNRAIDVHRTRHGATDERAGQARSAPDAPPAHSPGPAETLERQEELRDVVLAISGLPVLERSALVAQSFEGKASDQIAHEQGTSTGAVRMAIHRGRSRLRERLAVFSPIPLFLGFKSIVGRIRDAGPAASGAAATAGIAAVAVSVALATGIGGDGRNGERTAVASADQPAPGKRASASKSKSEPRKAASEPKDAAKSKPGGGSPDRSPQQSSRPAPSGQQPAPSADGAGPPPAPTPGSQSDQSQQASSEIETSPGPQQPTPDPPTPEPEPPPTPEPAPAPPPPPPATEPSPAPPPAAPPPAPGSQGCGGLLPCVVDLVEQILGPRGG